VRDFDSSPSGQVAIEMEFLFQLQGLESRVGLTPSFAFCNIKKTGGKRLVKLIGLIVKTVLGNDT